ncbi:MAG: fimbrial protein FimV, partial [Lysobacter sp.]
MRAAVVLALVIATSSAAALGLGQIQLKSKLGEPLLAEIPIVSSDPSELENLRAGLASPETFARIGLQRPQGVLADLQFVPALDSAGRPVIRVTSAVPIAEPLLTFLVEVDWGQGRLVREYSTL